MGVVSAPIACLQIFFNLSEDELSTVVRQAVQRVERRIVGELRGATDASTLGASAGSGACESYLFVC